MALEGTLSIGEVIDEMLKAERVTGVSKKQCRDVLKAFEEEVVDCLANGYKVTIPGFLRIEPKVKIGAKKGTKVRNPSTGEVKTLRADKPDEFKVKATAASKSITTRAFPSPRSSEGQSLMKLLKRKPAKKRK